MSLPAYCKITGETQGLITEGNLTEASVGGSWQEEHQDQILVQSFSQEVKVPRDAYSGEAAGHRQNGPVHITKEIDKSTALLHQALFNNELLTEVVFTFYRVNAAGVQEEFFVVTLEDAYVASIHDRLPDVLEPGNTRFPMVEDVTFVFRKITWEHKLASTMATDEWRDPAL
jgi:type VI secretion system secreted protein Hcp